MEWSLWASVHKTTYIMRFLLLSLLLVATLSTHLKAQEVEWITLNEAEERMKKEPRKVLVDVYTS